jgi:hypothetical protein
LLLMGLFVQTLWFPGRRLRFGRGRPETVPVNGPGTLLPS